MAVKVLSDDDKAELVRYAIEARVLTAGNARFERVAVTEDDYAWYDADRAKDDDEYEPVKREDGELGVRFSCYAGERTYSWDVESWVSDKVANEASFYATLDDVAFGWERGCFFSIGLVIESPNGMAVALDGPIEGWSLGRSADGVWRLTASALPYATGDFNGRPYIYVGGAGGGLLEIDATLRLSDEDEARREGINQANVDAIKEAMSD